jgi:hypothetical protein
MRTAPEGYVEAAALRSAARELGWELSPDAMKRLRREGLLQPAVQLHPGGRPGTMVVYPPAALDQIRRLAPLRRRERRFDELRVLAWWERLWVDDARLAASLDALLVPLDSEIATLGAGRDPLDAAELLAAKILKGRSRSPLATIRRRLNRNPTDLWTVLVAFGLAVYGDDIAWDVGDPAAGGATPAEAIVTAFGFDRLLWAFGDDGEWARGELLSFVEETFEQLRDAFSPGAYRRPLAAADAAELSELRDTARVLAEKLPLLTALRRGMASTTPAYNRSPGSRLTVHSTRRFWCWRWRTCARSPGRSLDACSQSSHRSGPLRRNPHSPRARSETIRPCRGTRSRPRCTACGPPTASGGRRSKR